MNLRRIFALLLAAIAAALLLSFVTVKVDRVIGAYEKDLLKEGDQLFAELQDLYRSRLSFTAREMLSRIPIFGKWTGEPQELTRPHIPDDSEMPYRIYILGSFLKSQNRLRERDFIRTLLWTLKGSSDNVPDESEKLLDLFQFVSRSGCTVRDYVPVYMQSTLCPGPPAAGAGIPDAPVIGYHLREVEEVLKRQEIILGFSPLFHAIVDVIEAVTIPSLLLLCLGLSLCERLFSLALALLSLLGSFCRLFQSRKTPPQESLSLENEGKTQEEEAAEQKSPDRTIAEGQKEVVAVTPELKRKKTRLNFLRCEIHTISKDKIPIPLGRVRHQLESYGKIPHVSVWKKSQETKGTRFCTVTFKGDDSLKEALEKVPAQHVIDGVDCTFVSCV